MRPADERALVSNFLIGYSARSICHAETSQTRITSSSRIATGPHVHITDVALALPNTIVLQLPPGSPSPLKTPCPARTPLFSSFPHLQPATPTRTFSRHGFLSNRLPTFLELNQDNFQLVMNAPQQPLVVLVAANPSQVPEVRCARFG